MPCLVCSNAPKRDTGGHILTEWPFCHAKSAIEHKRRYAHLKTPFGSPVLGVVQPRIAVLQFGGSVDIDGYLVAQCKHLTTRGCYERNVCPSAG